MRQYTWDKQLEHIVKSSGIIGGGKGGPTVMNPRSYKIRFREAMDRYFEMLPDKFSARVCVSLYQLLYRMRC